MSEQLKPCPFCGNRKVALMSEQEAEILDERPAYGDYYAVVCPTNDGGCGASGGWFNIKQCAAEFWNRRAQEEAEKNEPQVHGRWIKDKSGVIYCSECEEEHEWLDFRATYCDACGAKMDKEEEN